ncbi:MAG: ATP-binding cassette domain-containing protein [Spirochaetia bacterium]|nr:ATP-binding cassette domain-containing protein [Spirochaetia bacterium]
MIKVESISKSFNSIEAVKDISFHIQKGEIVGLLGPNGAGKTTTMRMMTGFYKPDSGSIQIGGLDILKDRLEIQKKTGYLPENSALYADMLVCDYLYFIACSYQLDQSTIQKNMDYAVTATALEKYFYRPVAQLSKGYKQRVGIAATLIHDPAILILDEPTSGLDPNQIAEIQRLIKLLAQSKTIILSTHILKEVENTCQRAIIISEGKIVMDEPLSNVHALKKGGYKTHLTLAGQISGISEILEREFREKVQENFLENESRFVLTASEHMGEKIFQCAKSNNWPLKELYTEKESLENIFKDLTGGQQ